MSLFIESILYENGQFPLLDYHIERMRKTLNSFDLPLPPDLDSHLRPPRSLSGDRYKTRIVYHQTIKKVDWIRYRKANPQKVRLVDAGDFDYSLKYADRSFFSGQLEKWPEFQDLIFVKNGLITDSTYCNILVKRDGNWFTPEKPLLKGVRRKYLLDKKVIKTASITPADLLKRAEEIRLVNALMPFDDCIVLSPKQLFPSPGVL